MIQFIKLILLGFVVHCSFFSIGQCNADLFVSAASANSVMRFDESTGEFLGNFVAPGSGGLGDPQGIAFGPDGNLYVASQISDNVLRYDGQTGAFIDVFASIPGVTWPAEINFRGNHLYMSDFGATASVYRIDVNTGNVETFATGVPAADGQEWDADGNMYVSSNNSVRQYDSDGNFVDLFVPNGIGLALDNLFLPDGTLLVSDFNGGVIKQYDANGNFLGNVITLGGPQGLEIGPDGHLYAGSFFTGIINRYDINTFDLLGQAANAASSTNNFTFSPRGQVPEPTALLLVGFFSGVIQLRRLRV